MADVDELVRRLVEAIRDEIPDRRVIDGWVGEDLPHRLIAVAWDPFGGQSPAITEDVEEEGEFGTLAFVVSVACIAASWDGNEDIPGKRKQVLEDLLRVDERLAVESKAANRLGGLVLDIAAAPQRSWYAFTDDQGPTVQCDFTIRARVA